MKTKKLFYLLVSLMFMVLFIPSFGRTQPTTKENPPIITHSFAVEKGQYGYIWKIYIEAEAKDADMFKIASVVDQPGYGHYPTDWIILKPGYRRHLKGYIQWNTFSSKASYLREWTPITLRVSIFDKAGNESNEVVFPFTFESWVKGAYQYKLPSPFDQGDLPRFGYIAIDLIEPTMDRGGNNRED
jgi:hypothetical protein